MSNSTRLPIPQPGARTVLYCLVGRRTGNDAPVEFLMLEKHGSPTFPPTRFRPREDLYRALVRTMEQDLSLPRDTYFPEKEMDMLPSAGPSHRYEGLARSWH